MNWRLEEIGTNYLSIVNITELFEIIAVSHSYTNGIRYIV